MIWVIPLERCTENLNSITMSDLILTLAFFPKTSRPVLANQEIVDHMVKDIEKLDIGNNGRQSLQARTEKDCEDGFDNECENNVYSFIILYGHPFVFSCNGAVNASCFAWMISLFCLIFLNFSSSRLC